MDLVEDDPGHLAHDFGAAVQHGAQDLGGHDQTAGGGVDGDVARHQADVAELSFEVAVLLVAEGLDGAGVDDALVALEALGDGVLGDDCLAGAGVGGHEHALVALDRGHRQALEGVELEGVDARGLGGGLVLRERDVFIVQVRRQGDLVLDVMGQHQALGRLFGGREALGGCDLARLGRLERVGGDGVGLGVAPAPLGVALRSRVGVVCLVVAGRGREVVGITRRVPILHLDVGVGLALLLGARRLAEDIEELVHDAGTVGSRAIAWAIWGSWYLVAFHQLQILSSFVLLK